MNIITFITDNWAGIVAGIAAGVVFLKPIAKLTPTTKDDEFVARLEAVEKTLEDVFDKHPAIAPTDKIVAKS